MEKQFVPYELAVKLKELGFDEPCLAKYGMVSKRFYDNYVPYKNSEDIHEPTGTFFNDFVSAPLWQQAFDWFRVEKGYKSHVGYSEIDNFYYEINWNLESFGDFKDYESARLACIEKLIEIVSCSSEN